MISIPRRIASLLAAALLVMALGACAANAPRSSARSDPTHAQCTRARIGQRIACLAVGKRCKPKYNHAYGEYGLVCKRSKDGSYRLRQRIFQGPPVPTPTGTGTG